MKIFLIGMPGSGKTTALTNSVNTVWAEVAEELGSGTMYDYMEKFGFKR